MAHSLEVDMDERREHCPYLESCSLMKKLSRSSNTDAAEENYSLVCSTHRMYDCVEYKLNEGRA